MFIYVPIATLSILMLLGIANAEYIIHYEAAKKSTAKYLKVRCGATEDVEARIQKQPSETCATGLFVSANHSCSGCAGL